MNTINLLFGEGEQLTILQMSLRASGMFFIMLILIRMAGRRTFSRKTSFDNIIVILLGAVLARGVVGVSPYWSTVAASAVMVILHRLIAWLCVKNIAIEKVIKGENITLYNNGVLMQKHLEESGMSQNELQESLRLETNKIRFSDIDSAYLETNGRISFILKKEDKD